MSRDVLTCKLLLGVVILSCTSASGQVEERVFASGFEASEVPRLARFEAGAPLYFDDALLALTMGCNAAEPLAGTIELEHNGEVDESDWHLVVDGHGQADNVLQLHPHCDGSEPRNQTLLLDMIKNDDTQAASAAIDLAIAPEYVLMLNGGTEVTCGDVAMLTSNADPGTLELVIGVGLSDGNTWTYTTRCDNLGEKTILLEGRRSTEVHEGSGVYTEQVSGADATFNVVPQSPAGIDRDRDGSIDTYVTDGIANIRGTNCAAGGYPFNFLIDGEQLTNVIHTPLATTGESTSATLDVLVDGSASITVPDTCEDYGEILSSTITLQYDGGEITFEFQTDVSTDKQVFIRNFVTDNLNENLFSVSYVEAVKAINGTAKTASYNYQISEILLRAEPTPPWTQSQMEENNLRWANGILESGDAEFSINSPYGHQNNDIGNPKVILSFESSGPLTFELPQPPDIDDHYELWITILTDQVANFPEDYRLTPCPDPQDCLPDPHYDPGW